MRAGLVFTRWAEPELQPVRLTPESHQQGLVEWTSTKHQVGWKLRYFVTSVFPLDIIPPGQNYILAEKNPKLFSKLA